MHFDIIPLDAHGLKFEKCTPRHDTVQFSAEETMLGALSARRRLKACRCEEGIAEHVQ